MGSLILSLVHSLLWSLLFLVLIPFTLIKPSLSERVLCILTGILLIFLGLILFLLSVWELSRAGGTTTVLKRAKRLVKGGVYSCSRNPIYVAVILISLGESLTFCSSAFLGYTFLLTLGLHLWVILFEEPMLRRIYGDEFEDYSKEVPRWVAFPDIVTCLGRRRRNRSSQLSPLS
ncbi:protein-S-isoprenylcysteine O-methyltransferase Ste14 [Hydrogenivirga caldilitoris]|uniref:Protein-S-isoprenylcysteine O-methyltransferase Ste14 n=1 Tax=Hydrogenivirga caldilitoris TaxID=246264 RepID=A0A497XM73_9AQUI|nr:protein-S-isoprenylcysteine O-methyltransferase Ste14 [Hydrogenivirga caldilitoris]